MKNIFEGEVWSSLSQNPRLLVIALPLCVLAYKAPEIIRALAAAYVSISKSNVDVKHKQAMYGARIKAEIEKKKKKKEKRKKS